MAKEEKGGCLRRAVILFLVLMILYTIGHNNAEQPDESASSQSSSVQSQSQPAPAPEPAAKPPAEEAPAQPAQPAQSVPPAQAPGKYDAVVGAAESLKEQYPDISWSSQWEELQSMGYSYEEIAWAIGG